MERPPAVSIPGRLAAILIAFRWKDKVQVTHILSVSEVMCITQSKMQAWMIEAREWKRLGGYSMPRDLNSSVAVETGRVLLPARDIPENGRKMTK